MSPARSFLRNLTPESEKAVNVERTEALIEGYRDDGGDILVLSPDHDWLLLDFLDKFIETRLSVDHINGLHNPPMPPGGASVGQGWAPGLA